MDLIVASDIGTTGVKVSAFQVGSLVAVASNVAGRTVCEYYKMYHMVHPGNSMIEQLPKDWYDAYLECLAGVLEDLAMGHSNEFQIKALAFSGQMQALCLVGSQGPLRNAVLFSDARAREEAMFLDDRFGAEALVERTGNYKGAVSVLAKLLWFEKHEKELLATAEKILLGAHSFVVWTITKEANCDFTTAGTTSILDRAESGWATDILKTCGLESVTEKLPQLVAPDHITTTISKLWDIPGLQELLSDDTIVYHSSSRDILVFHGCGDLGTTTLGANHISPNPYMYVGTSGWLAETITKKPVSVKSPSVSYIAHPRKEKEIRVAPSTTCGGSIEWFRRVLATPGLTYKDFDDSCAVSSPGSNGVLFLPHLAGERCPDNVPHARGAFIGLCLSTTQNEMRRTVLEGVAFHFKWLREAMDIDADTMTLVGGGSKSFVWSQIFADILGCSIVVSSEAVDIATYGAASIASGVLLANHKGSTNTNTPKLFSPNASHTQLYNKLYTIW
eukprot:CAMPEP_0203755568 /NCGR_PEP_ID=MMETSP0098-20131031/8989_1 /ASSEMBLY_ACC=CAM_ASM_000208 /TAXON_ID=96639 /ORGANISM=" , Strain NY0313808BC1" /LENGTH=503 /DNA_ID=CAMNT_0050647077 /DNA_START=53 /DNA_END=1561 /DNA_ORIENTATION=+